MTAYARTRQLRALRCALGRSVSDGLPAIYGLDGITDINSLITDRLPPVVTWGAGGHALVVATSLACGERMRSLDSSMMETGTGRANLFVARESSAEASD